MKLNYSLDQMDLQTEYYNQQQQNTHFSQVSRNILQDILCYITKQGLTNLIRFKSYQVPFLTPWYEIRSR